MNITTITLQRIRPSYWHIELLDEVADERLGWTGNDTECQLLESLHAALSEAGRSAEDNEE